VPRTRTGPPLRLGILGAARIAPSTIITPAADLQDVEVRVVAARDPRRARTFATAHAIPHVAAGYRELLARTDIDAVYVALPLALHHPWTLAALRAGKHVLCEKPLAASAAQAAELAAAAEAAGLVLCEAAHWRFHPLADRVLDLLASGRLGPVRRVEAWFTTSITDPADIRFSRDLAGGAMMDLGVYPVHWARTFVGAEPVVRSAHAVERHAGVDVEMTGELVFPSGVTARVHASMAAGPRFSAGVRIECERGSLGVDNPLAPQLGNRITVRPDGAPASEEQVPGESSYLYQLSAFAAAVRTGAPLPMNGEDPVGTLRVLDALYRLAGLPPRAAPSPYPYVRNRGHGEPAV
jgi:predicted dehydrogenase